MPSFVTPRSGHQQLASKSCNGNNRQIGASWVSLQLLVFREALLARLGGV